MLNNKNKAMRLMAAVAIMALPAMVTAQGYYDDDIYYDASKAPKKANTVKKADKRATLADFPAADTYNVYTNNTRDVDEYNRHGAFLVADSISVDSLDNLDLFANTRRIERFHNGDIVAGSNDADLQAYYYSEPATVNIYVQNDPWYSPYWRWSWAFGSPSYYWNWSLGYYDPWWGPGWGPSWAWGWGPAWSWGPSWAWGPSWGWGPSWSWGPGWVGGGPHWAGRPSTGIGSSGTHRPTAGSGAGTRRPAAGGTHATPARPGNNGYGYGSGAASRPGYSGMGTNPRPAQSVGAGSRPANGTHGINTGVRGRGNISTSNNNNRSTNNSSWGTNNGSWGGSRGGYSTGGGSRGGYSTGGTRGGGGGGSRGRR